MNIGGRLTLTSGVEVTESDVTGAASVYLTPAGPGLDLTQIYDGSALQERQFTETTLTLTNALHLAGKTYPVFEAWNSGVLFLGTGPAWSANVPGGSDFSTVRGVKVNNGSITLKNGASSLAVADKQATYRGAIGITAVNGLTEDSYANRLIGNVYNTMPRPMAKHESASWNYSTATYRAANNSAANSITYVQPVGGRKAFARAQAICTNSTNTSRRVAVGIGVDSTSVDSSTLMAFESLINQEPMAVYAEYDGFPGVGRHTLYWLECGNGTDTQSWSGNPVQNNSGSATNYAPGIRGWTES